MKFSEVAQAFFALEQVSSRLEMTRLLADLYKKSSSHEAEIISNIALGQLHAPYVGTQFNLAEKNVMKVLAAVLKLPHDEIEKQAKKSW